ncbi:Fc.00g024680.m01.CDS01 [Cosmosporella sp. VM-42]
MASSESPLNELRSSWNVCKVQDDGKYILIENLFAYISDLSRQLSNAESDLRDKKDLLYLERSRLSEAKKQLQDVQHEKAGYMFAFVLIDGDCMPFKDDLVKQGLEGGQKTVNLLRQAVDGHLKDTMGSEANHVKVVARVYANLKGLSMAYKDYDVLYDPATLFEFVRGFNMGNDLCDFVDAGNGKECADEKIKAAFRINVVDVHCQQIYFGGAPDNGYARLLGPYRDDKSACQRITLLEGPPFAKELADLKDSFRTTTLANIFRSQKLPATNGRVSNHPSRPGSPPANYAAAAAVAVAQPVSSAHRASLPIARRCSVLGAVHRNRHGQRVDALLPSYSREDYFNLKSRKLCNAFHLTGICPHEDTYWTCHHSHDGKLSDKQLIALAAVARQSPCSTGLECDDPNCYNSHRCPRGDCQEPNCRWGEEMHGIDTKIVT